MKTVIVTTKRDRIQSLIGFVKALFPECEVDAVSVDAERQAECQEGSSSGSHRNDAKGGCRGKHLDHR